MVIIKTAFCEQLNEEPTGSCRVEPNDSGRCFDRVVCKMLPDLKLGYIYRLIRKAAIRLNESRKAALSHTVHARDRIDVPDDIAPSRSTREADSATDSGAPSPHHNILG